VLAGYQKDASTISHEAMASMILLKLLGNVTLIETQDLKHLRLTANANATTNVITTTTII